METLTSSFRQDENPQNTWNSSELNMNCYGWPATIDLKLLKGFFFFYILLRDAPVEQLTVLLRPSRYYTRCDVQLYWWKRDNVTPSRSILDFNGLIDSRHAHTLQGISARAPTSDKLLAAVGPTQPPVSRAAHESGGGPSTWARIGS